jgi:hypothetical protein
MKQLRTIAQVHLPLVAALASAAALLMACSRGESKFIGNYKANGEIPGLGTNPTLEFSPDNKLTLLIQGTNVAEGSYSLEGDEVAVALVDPVAGTKSSYFFKVKDHTLVKDTGEQFAKQ